MTQNGTPNTPFKQQKFNIGPILLDTFSIFFRRIHVFVLLGFVPLVVLNLVLGYFATVMTPPLMAMGGFGFMIITGIAVSVIVSIIANFVAAGFVVYAAYDIKLGRPLRFGHYVAQAFQQIIPLVVVSVIVVVFSVGGFLILSIVPIGIFGIEIILDTSSVGTWIVIFFSLIPSLWIATVLSVVVPSIVVEQTGFGGMWQSDSLTLGYRWPILGSLVLLHLGLIILAFILGSLMEAVFFTVAPIAGALLSGFVSVASSGILFVGIALIYIRLLELRYGKTLEQLAEASA